MAMTGWGDESGSFALKDPHAYILSAVLIRDADCADACHALRAVRIGRESKLHWRDDGDDRHAKVLTVVRSLPITAVVVVRTGTEDERAERRRRKCLERLMLETDSRGCHQLTLESRGPADDKRDRDLLDALRQSRTAPRRFKLDHSPGVKDPMLWAADAVCGAVAASRVGEPRWLAMLEPLVRMVAI